MNEISALGILHRGKTEHWSNSFMQSSTKNRIHPTAFPATIADSQGPCAIVASKYWVLRLSKFRAPAVTVLCLSDMLILMECKDSLGLKGCPFDGQIYKVFCCSFRALNQTGLEGFNVGQGELRVGQLTGFQLFSISPENKVRRQQTLSFWGGI